MNVLVGYIKRSFVWRKRHIGLSVADDVSFQLAVVAAYPITILSDIFE